MEDMLVYCKNTWRLEVVLCHACNPRDIKSLSLYIYIYMHIYIYMYIYFIVFMLYDLI